MFLDELFELVGRTAVGQGTAGSHVGYQHLLFRTKHFGRLAHEMNAAHHDDVCRRLGGLLRQGQTIAYIIGNFLYFTPLVVVSHNQRILLFLQLIDGFNEIIHNKYIFLFFFLNLMVMIIGC